MTGPNVHHLTLCIGDLLGHEVEVCGVRVIAGGEIVHSADGRTGVFFDEPPEIIAMRRWRAGDFLGVERDFRPAKKAHPALLVEGLEDLTAQLQARGYEVQPDKRLEGYLRYYVHDPFGNRIELMEPTDA